MGLLDGPLASAIYAGFKGRLSQGRLLRMQDAAGVDDMGDATGETPVLFRLEGFEDKYSDFFRAGAGIPDTDLKVCIFGASLPTGTRPLKDDRVELTRAGVKTWYQLRKDGVDPAGALWECQAFVIPEPEGA